MGKNRALREDIAFCLATFGGIGKILEDRMPGTVASVIALVIRWIVDVDIYTLTAVFFAGLWASNTYALSLKENDPPSIVVDEIIGYFVAMLGLPNVMLLPAFFFFRLLDILKPFPIRLFERFPNGWGIMLDDVVAGLISNGLIRLGIWFWG